MVDDAADAAVSGTEHAHKPAAHSGHLIQLAVGVVLLLGVALAVSWWTTSDTKFIRLTRTEQWDEMWPRWSPDGKWICFQASHVFEPGVTVHPHPNEMCVMEFSTRKIRRISEGLTGSEFGNRFNVSSWSPDSTMIAYRQSRGEKGERILVSWPDTGRLVTVCTGQAGTAWWSGSKLYYATVNEETQRMDGWVWDSSSAKSESIPLKELKRTAKPVTPSGGSPKKRWPAHDDGDWTHRNDLKVYHEFRSIDSPDDTVDLYLESTKTGKRIKLVADGWCPARSPDGRYIVFSRDGELYLYDLTKCSP